MERMIDARFLDKKIRSIISALNEEGFQTTQSCSGHKVKGVIEDGYIVLVGNLEEQAIKTLFDGFGLSVTKISHGNTYASMPGTIIRFKGLGGPKTHSRELLEFEPAVEERTPLIYALFTRNLERVGIHHFSRTSELARYALSKALQGKEVKRGVLEDESKV